MGRVRVTKLKDVLERANAALDKLDSTVKDLQKVKIQKDKSTKVEDKKEIQQPEEQLAWPTTH
jgi:hypothetical protein